MPNRAPGDSRSAHPPMSPAQYPVDPLNHMGPIGVRTPSRSTQQRYDWPLDGAGSTLVITAICEAVHATVPAAVPSGVRSVVVQWTGVARTRSRLAIVAVRPAFWVSARIPSSARARPGE